ncbi:MAG: NADP oxidoreductase [Bacteroidetes bacterium]|nr:NADP oxidoreductase [Bacteroidota bacterium]
MKAKIATTWLDGCSGCHMSFLDIDERLLAIADRIELVYSPLVDNKVFPDYVDVTIVEGAVASVDDLAKIKKIRKHTKYLIALGDCAINANVPSMRNPIPVQEIINRAYVENAFIHDVMPKHPALPELLARVMPIHEVVPVDVFIPGCPPSNDTIFYAVAELLDGRIPDLTSKTRFGA